MHVSNKHILNHIIYEVVCVSFDVDGLIWVEKWNCLQHAVASAFLALLYSDYMLTSQTEVLYCDGKTYKPEDLRSFAISQVFKY